MFKELFEMKKTLVAVVLAVAGIAFGQQTAAPQPQTAAAQPQAAAAPQQKKEIKDPAEYNAYVGAIQQSDPAAKISGLLDFIQRYPNSAYKEDPLEQLMALYQ